MSDHTRPTASNSPDFLWRTFLTIPTLLPALTAFAFTVHDPDSTIPHTQPRYPSSRIFCMSMHVLPI